MVGKLAAVICIGAGLYLLTSQAAGENSYLELLAHGIGAYFIGKGLFVWRSIALAEEIRDGVWAAGAADDEGPAPPP